MNGGLNYEHLDEFKNDAEFRGYMRAKIEGIDDKFKAGVTRMEKNEKKAEDQQNQINRNSKALVKIFSVASTAGAVFGIIFSFIGDWFKGIFTN